MASVEKRNGNYRSRYVDPTGRRRSKTFTRKADAERFVREVQVEIDRGNWISPSGAEMTLAKWAEEFLSLCRGLSLSTQRTYRRDLDLYVLPCFGSYKIGKLQSAEIENWLCDEIDTGLAPSSVHRHYRTLRRALEVAVEKEKILANPCVRVRPPRIPRKEMAFLTWSEGVALAEALPERYRALIYLALDTGMRWGELIGLRRARIDLIARKVRVTEQMIYFGSGEWVRKEPKTPASRRSITISQFTSAVLAEQPGSFIDRQA